MKKEEFEEKVLRRLEVLIALRMDDPQPERPSSVASKVSRLTGLGLAPSEIGNILGKSTEYVTAVLSTKRARGKTKKGK